MKDCKRCGDCCSKFPCGIAHSLVSDKRPCVALEQEEDRYVCGLLKHASKYIPEAKPEEDEILAFVFGKILGVGMGCSNSPETQMLIKRMKIHRGDMECRRKSKK